MKKIVTAFAVIVLLSCNNHNNNSLTANVEDNSNPAPPAITYNVVKVYPHDTSFFTEGLIWYNNSLYESTGMENESRLVKTNLDNGKGEQKIDLPATDFGEGIAILNNKIYQLTYQNHKAYVYDLATFKKLQEFSFPFEGWGMTTDGKNLIISTGTSNLYYFDPQNFKLLSTVGVTNNYGPVGNINELEYIRGVIYANIYQTDNIIKIDPQTGKVTGIMNMQNLLKNSGKAVTDTNELVLNGIAYDSAKNALYVTGKRWPALFEIKLN